MKKRTRRKVYQLMNPITLAIEGAGITTEDKLNKLRQRELAAIDAFARGAASETEWHDMLMMVLLSVAMAERNIGPEALEAASRADEALTEDRKRYLATGKMGTTGPGLQAYRDIYQYLDLQRQSISRAEFERIIGATRNKFKTSSSFFKQTQT